MTVTPHDHMTCVSVFLPLWVAHSVSLWLKWKQMLLTLLIEIRTKRILRLKRGSCFFPLPTAACLSTNNLITEMRSVPLYTHSCRPPPPLCRRDTWLCWRGWSWCYHCRQLMGFLSIFKTTDKALLGWHYTTVMVLKKEFWDWLDAVKKRCLNESLLSKGKIHLCSEIVLFKDTCALKSKEVLDFGYIFSLVLKWTSKIFACTKCTFMNVIIKESVKSNWAVRAWTRGTEDKCSSNRWCDFTKVTTWCYNIWLKP